MMYRREDDEIITNAADALWDSITFVVTDDNMLSDGGYTYANADFNGIEKRWDDKIIGEIALRYRCKLHDREITHKIFGDDIEGATMAMIQAVTAVETYLYFMNATEGDK